MNILHKIYLTLIVFCLGLIAPFVGIAHQPELQKYFE